MSTTDITTTKTLKVFLARGFIAIAWAAVFAAVADSLTVGVGVLLVIYPLIDAAASLVDARNQHRSARRLLLANAAVSTLAAVALGFAATGSVANVLAVFGAWALISGAAQLTTAIRRRVLLGKQWPMRLAGGVSVLLGVAFVAASTGTDPKLSMLAIYAATGGVDFVIQAWLLGRRRRQTVNASTGEMTVALQS